MKLTGDYTLFLDKEEIGYKLTAIEFKQEPFAYQGGKPVMAYKLKCTSVHGEYYDKQFGIVLGFTLRNNKNGVKTRYEIGRKPHRDVNKQIR